uniref:Putative diguanylate phosphodiesterase n=1 Tax=uncultured bacterium CSL1 TaxID=1091565 RepID=G4WVA8_9BACT|nr:putative diguanylate phosphodiesterase [uncultured bacterium CSL1]
MFTVSKDSEVKLVETLNAIAEESASWQAVHFHLGGLLEEFKSPYQTKIAVNMVGDLLRSYTGGQYVMLDGSLVVLCRETPQQLVQKLIFQLRYLHMDDPLAYSPDGQENQDFCTYYVLEKEWQKFYDECTRRMTFVAKRMAPTPGGARGKDDNKAEEPPVKIDPSGNSTRTSPFSAARLANVEQDLTHADLSRSVRRQPVCAAIAGSPVRPVFDELYIHIAHLRQLLRADVDFLGNKWLFKYLTEILDERVLYLLRHNPARYLETPISLNLNVQTLMSDSFLDFDAVVKPAVKVSMVLEINVMDVFSDISAFNYVRSSVQKMGYRVCLDGLNSDSILQIDRQRLGCDLVKLQWNADLEADINTPENKALTAAVKQCGPNRVILCRCDSRHAVQYGQAMGISLFQGRHLDMVLNPSAKIAN